MGGAQVAYDALLSALGSKRSSIVGVTDFAVLTQEQRFFIAFSQAWRSKARTEWEVNSLRTGQHSLPLFRVMGPIANMDEFAGAFSCPADKAMLGQADRANIW